MEDGRIQKNLEAFENTQSLFRFFSEEFQMVENFIQAGVKENVYVFKNFSRV